jgi:hypothetical protein
MNVFIAGCLLETLNKINRHYGRGQVDRFDVDADGNGVATISYGWVSVTMEKMVENCKFKFKDGRVKFRGVTRTLGYKIR